MSKDYKYKRVLLKLSGEGLANPDGHGLDMNLVESLGKEIKKIVDDGIEVGIVIGGGNIIRGAQQENMDRASADYMGMLATVINAMGLAEGFKNVGLKAKAVSSIPMERVCDTYLIRNARESLANGEVLIFGGGTSSPFFTTDSNAALRACELKCDCVLKVTKVDGVYDSDPMKNADAKKYDNISYIDVLAKRLGVMDLTAISMCMDNDIPVMVLNIKEEDSIKKALKGENIGTLVH